jgi:wobble nucleotide-excising tRNase
MIQRIKRLRAWGIFRDFTGDAASGIPPFKKRNLIYGWNYSGKTTLSRLFQALQFPGRPPVYPACHFSVELTGGTEANENARVIPHPVRVFNRDFITANFQEEHSAPAVFIVGEENLALRDRLEKFRIAQAQFEAREMERQSQIDRIERDDAAAGTARATAIGHVLGVRDFRRPDLEGCIRDVRTNPAAFQMTEERCRATIDTFRSGDQFSDINLGGWSTPDLSLEVEAVRILLSRTASFDAIEGLRENRSLEDWLRTGLGFHPSSGVCQFCKGTLPEERLDELRRHFSTAAMELLREINQKIEQLQRVSFDPPRLTAMEFLQETREQARTHLVTLANWLAHAATIRDSMVGALEGKRTALEIPLTWDGSTERLAEGIQVYGALNQCIGQHNSRIRDIGRVKREAREAIERHYAAVHFVEQRIAAHEAEIRVVRARIRRATRAKARLGRIADAIAQQIDRAAKGASRFMSLVEFLLRGSDIKIESRGESMFQLMRGTAVADKLSEGEKTAIAFAYFLTSLEGEGEDITRDIVYVDDPISSLDSNHVYAVYALITEHLHKALQLFVSTHNSEFFSLLKGLWLERDYRADSELFYIRRLSDANGAYATLESLPLLLRKYKSEYEFIFAQLHAFAETASPSEHEAYIAPNLLRRFLEAYLGFRKPCTTAWHKKIDLILDSPEECVEVHKLLNDASHLQNINRALQHPSFVASAQPCVRSILRGLQAKDPLHYNSLIAVVTNRQAPGTT